MIEIEKPNIEVEEISKDGSYGRFVVEPLERGFGTTVGQFTAPDTDFFASGGGGNVYQGRRGIA